MIDILIADDDPLVRVGLRAVLDGEPNLRVVGEASDGREAVTMTADLAPSLVIMDIRMPNLDGLAATRQIMTAPNPPRVLVFPGTPVRNDSHRGLQAINEILGGAGVRAMVIDLVSVHIKHRIQIGYFLLSIRLNITANKVAKATELD